MKKMILNLIIYSKNFYALKIKLKIIFYIFLFIITTQKYNLNYKLLSDSIYYYRTHGYVYIEAPWTITEDAIKITTPPGKKQYKVNDKCLVASAEQSFLQLILDKKIKPGSYVACTPCFRDEDTYDELHHEYFMKVELIKWDRTKPTEKELTEIIDCCLNFFNKYIKCKVIPVDEKYHKGYDIITEDNIELGSYGIRSHKDIHWIYATGCATPRLIQAINKNKTVGYHNMIISKYPIGTYGKIFEEIDEMKDCILENNKVMELIELSDIYGAIELYLEKKYKMKIEDIKKMSDTTKRAFINGIRK